MHKPSIAEYLGGLVTGICEAEISNEERLIVRRHFLDALACAFAGCRGRVFLDVTKSCQKMTGGRCWPGSGSERAAPHDAGMIWAFAVHASVFDDGSREGACHPGAVVIPVAVALCQDRRWDLVDRSIIAGYDVMVRLARGGNPAFTQKGFHPTSITAPFGAAATASVMLGHNKAKTENSLCLAALCSAGLMAAFRSGRSQPLQVAWAVRNGISAAIMAGAGHRGYGRILEEGFYPAYLGTPPDPPIETPLERRYAIQSSYLRAYPGCRHMHPSIDAIGEILRENAIPADKIRSIRAGTYGMALEIGVDQLRNRGDAYFNLPYAMAARVVLGRSDYNAFDENHFGNEKILSLMKRVEVTINPELDSLYPQLRGSVVEIQDDSGRIYSAKVSYPLGEPENPLSLSAVTRKFRDLSTPLLSNEARSKIEAILDASDPEGTPEDLLEAVKERPMA